MVITSVSPKAGKVGDKIVITGSGLDTGPAKSAGPGSVTFNGVKATPSKWTDTEVCVDVPTGAVTGPLCVAVGGDAVEVQFMVTPALHNEPVEEKEKSADAEDAIAHHRTVGDEKSQTDKGKPAAGSGPAGPMGPDPSTVAGKK